MICLNCGKHVDDDVRVCPFCGSVIADAEAAPEDDPLPINLPPREHPEDGFERLERSEPAPAPAPAPAGKSIFTPAFFLSLLSLILGVLCLLAINSLHGAIAELNKAQTESLSALNATVSAANDRLDQLDSTLATVQTQAYEQVASQSISITKDITPLTGPVDEGKYNQMFIVKAKGNLDVDTSFDWQRYNEATGGWVSIVFTGDATTNEQYGLRLENQFNQAEKEYTTILWAQGITQDAAGTYRCVITDAGGITKISAEATVEITPAEE
ncbi:MAG: zinc ribbon domain-containing protein [Oscillospiraceae bacterium]|nr:zinc ribbon domain-containing protein [Oscillospiraceae bacterium]